MTDKVEQRKTEIVDAAESLGISQEEYENIVDECIFGKEEPVSEVLEEAIAREWQGYNDRGASTVDALEDNTQELAFAKGFYRGAQWKKQQAINNACEWLQKNINSMDWLMEFRKMLEE